MRGFQTEAHNALLLTRELDCAIVLINESDELPPEHSQIIAQTFSAGISVWARLLPVMTALLAWEESLTQQG